MRVLNIDNNPDVGSILSGLAIEDFTPQAYLGLALAILMDTQRDLHDISPPAQKDASFKVQTQQNFLALQVELVELLQEMDWKPWKPDELTDSWEQRKLIAAEFADVLAFLGHIVRILQDDLGITSADLAEAYRVKTQKNVKRFTNE